MLLRQASMAVASCLMVTACQAGFSPESNNLEDDTEQAASALTAGSTRYVSPGGDDANDGRTARRAKRTVQGAITSLGPAPSGVIRLAAGEYPDPFNLEDATDLTIVGAGESRTTLRPRATVGWNVLTYGESRRAAYRVVRSRDVTIRGVTFDFEAVHGDLVAGLLLWDSAATVRRSTFTNMSSDASYYEFTVYASAPSFTAENRARVTFLQNTFARTGRVGVLLHTQVEGVITGNTFYNQHDFGYAIEVSSQATADIVDNLINGYSTVAASDGSASAGVLIDNSFTLGAAHVEKRVSLRANELYDNGYGVSIGNAYAGLAGDVDVVVDLASNVIRDNRIAGVQIVDEGRSAGSSVTVRSRGDTVIDNGQYGYLVQTFGNGEVRASLTRQVLRGQPRGVALLEDTGASVHEVSIHDSVIRDHGVAGIDNAGPGVVDATSNWWGTRHGPLDATGTTEVDGRNCSAVMLSDRLNQQPDTDLGNAVLGAVNYCDWLSRAPR